MVRGRYLQCNRRIGGFVRSGGLTFKSKIGEILLR